MIEIKLIKLKVHVRIFQNIYIYIQIMIKNINLNMSLELKKLKNILDMIIKENLNQNQDIKNQIMNYFRLNYMILILVFVILLVQITSDLHKLSAMDNILI